MPKPNTKYLETTIPGPRDFYIDEFGIQRRFESDTAPGRIRNVRLPYWPIRRRRSPPRPQTIPILRFPDENVYRTALDEPAVRREDGGLPTIEDYEDAWIDAFQGYVIAERRAVMRTGAFLDDVELHRMISPMMQIIAQHRAAVRQINPNAEDPYWNWNCTPEEQVRGIVQGTRRSIVNSARLGLPI